MAVFAGCMKSDPNNGGSNSLPLVLQAQSFFNNSITQLGKIPNLYNYRAKQQRTVLWDKATIKHLLTGDAVVAPVTFGKQLFVAYKSSPNHVYNLNDLTSLVITYHSNGRLSAYMVTFIPDSADNYEFRSGYYFVEDWQGNSIYSPIHQSADKIQVTKTGTPSSASKQVEFIQSIQVCNEIDGYNYSQDDPDGGYYWSETTCTNYGYSSGGNGGGLLGADLPGLALPNLRPSGIVVPPPGNPISNITDYFKCFTNGSTPDHTYSVQVCVDQPDPGTRQAWGFTPGGPSGSSSAGNLVNSGHVFLILSENDQGNITTRNVGFYPSTLVIPTTSGAYSQGALNNDQSHTFDISLTVNVSSNQFYSVLNYVSLGNNPGYDYNLSTNNCTTFAINAMAAGGVSLPSTNGSWPGGSGNDPGDLGEDIRNMPLSSNMSRNTVDSDHPNTGNCN